MPRSYRTVAAAFFTTLALATTSYAAPVKAKSHAHALVGTLEKVDGQTITVQTPKGSETVMLVSKSRIHRGAATIQPASLPSYSGQRVKVRYVDSNGEKQAQTVTLSSAPKAGAAPKAASSNDAATSKK